MMMSENRNPGKAGIFYFMIPDRIVPGILWRIFFRTQSASQLFGPPGANLNEPLPSKTFNFNILRFSSIILGASPLHPNDPNDPASFPLSLIGLIHAKRLINLQQCILVNSGGSDNNRISTNYF